jgi:uncharacterized RDD family membrane protein YckC
VNSPFLFAGFWLRACAAIVDLAILGVPLVVFASFAAVARGTPLAFVWLEPNQAPSAVIAEFGKPAVLAMLCFFVLISWLYFALMESSAWQATVGKRIFGLYVTDARGERVAFARASGRFAGGRLLAHVPYGGLIYFFGDCLCAGVTPRKQALHDSMARCLVLRRSGARQQERLS